MPRPRITPSNAKRALGVAKVVVPVMAPFVLKAAAQAKHSWDRARARRLGVEIGMLPQVSGPGATLSARLARLAMSLHQFVERHPDDVDAAKFVETADVRLADLSAAMRAAELMPTARRRAAHRAVGIELDALENELLRRLGLADDPRRSPR